MFRVLLALLALLTLTACAAPKAAVAPINDQTALLVQNGWSLAGGSDPAQYTVAAQGSADQAAQQALDASKKIGLDFTALAGKQLTLQNFPLNEPSTSGQSVRGNVLMDGTNVVGAWLTVGDAIYALNAKP